jgi:dTDP-4-amino-4,6-dideoxygalactose transaminase
VRVPFLDVAAATLEVRAALDQAWQRVASSGQYIAGTEVSAFEEAFAKSEGALHGVGTGNGLDAIHLALRAMGIGPGDDVLVPSNTFIATWLAVVHSGARPVPVEPDEATHNVTAEGLVAALTPKTRAAVPVHLYGRPAPMKDIREALPDHIRLVDDAAQAHGATLHGKPVGSWSDATAWSFYPGKNLGALGDAGAVTTNDDVVAKTVRLLGNYGSPRKYQHDVLGFNSRLDPLQAAFLLVKLARLPAWNERRRSIAHQYDKGFASLQLQLAQGPSGGNPVHHLYVVRSSARDKLAKDLAEREIETLVHYPVPPHLQLPFLGSASALPTARQLASEVLSLPIGPHLSDGQVAAVIKAVQECA